jgi:hypothetical protein
MRPGQPVPFAVAAAGMGQNLFSPPNVKGWPGGEAWINTSTLLARKQFLDRLFRADNATGRMPAAGPTMADAVVPKATDAADDSELARKIRLMRAMERGMNSVHFDSDVWFGQLEGVSDDRAAAATRMLLAYAPQARADPGGEPLAMVRQIVLDASYQLK